LRYLASELTFIFKFTHFSLKLALEGVIFLLFLLSDDFIGCIPIDDVRLQSVETRSKRLPNSLILFENTKDFIELALLGH